ncbi:ABC transporter ATP-binding protein [Ruegeria sp. HKCCD8929]|uniref:ABC transporter ATP-binding protein n=1 Tax=Ruegeria sp. HKCCD8929 TaxID=2683006 RepID=UPI0014878B1B|nr:ABC transporter ATP-binding protein [Ruegeria sp. HKCCD8929]
MADPVLQTRGLTAHYGDFQALFGIDFEIRQGETVAIIGSNGAGKSTFLRSITGMLNTAGQDIAFLGQPVGGISAHDLVRKGLAMVPEGRKLFPSLTVEENLLIGAYGRSGSEWTLETIYDLFPILAERRHHGGTDLSGGQQQMVAIGRALMSNPKLLLCDEISLGLAPIVIKDIYEAVPKINAHGATMVVVEQDVNQAMAVADRVYCFQEGRVSLTGKPDELTREQISAAYFGLEDGEAA